jgi:fructose-1,6-bisphosphatase I
MSDQAFSGAATDTVFTISRFILEHQPPAARGEFTHLLDDIALAAKLIAQKTTRAGLVDILGDAPEVNVQGEQQKKLDVFADDIMFRIFDHTGRLCAMASEERERVIPIPERFERGSYILVYDPLDGSSNIDVNVSIGTIFGIYRTLDWASRGSLEDVLQPGRSLAAAGYVLYGASTMLVYSAGQGVHGFTLNPEIGEFLLSHPSIRLPQKPAYYSVNGARYSAWSEGNRRYLDWLERQEDGAPTLSLRYIGSLVADFHRNLLKGGVFCYPAETARPDGKLRLLYEAAPLAFLIDQAGGYASDGRRPILDIQPNHLHQRVPLYIGNRWLVEKAETLLRQHG